MYYVQVPVLHLGQIYSPVKGLMEEACQTTRRQISKVDFVYQENHQHQ